MSKIHKTTASIFLLLGRLEPVFVRVLVLQSSRAEAGVRVRSRISIRPRTQVERGGMLVAWLKTPPIPELMI